MRADQTNIRFVAKDKLQQTFYTTLSQRVNQYFKDNNLSKKANATMVGKTIIMLLLYAVPFTLLLLVQPGFLASMLLWLIMGFAMAGVGMGIMHDAIHGAYSKKAWVNNLLGYTLNLVGGAKYNWHMQHNMLHHTYTNIADWDEDINGKGVVRLNPHNKHKSFHRPQWLYAFLLYGILTLYWVVGKDFVQYTRYIKNGMNTNTKVQNLSLLIRIIWIKVVYLFVFLVMPVVFFGLPFATVITGFFLMHFVAGVMLTVIFQLAHSVEETEHPLPNKEGNIENAWAIHQMETTMNFSRDNKFLNWYLGGLNYQVEHHLFPKICHVHYPKIAPIVRSTAAEFGVPYKESNSFGEAVNSHIMLLQRYGKLPNINDAIV